MINQQVQSIFYSRKILLFLGHYLKIHNEPIACDKNVSEMHMRDKFILYNSCTDTAIISNLPLPVRLPGALPNGHSDDLLSLLGISNTVKPRPDRGPLPFKLLNFVSVDKCKTNIIETINKAMSSEGVNRERNGWLAVGSDDHLVLKIDRNLKTS